MKIHELSNLELFEAIKQTYDMIGATHTSLRRFGPLSEHLEALLRERQRRAETRLRTEQEKP